MKLARPFIRLPLAFDAAQLAREAAQLEAAAWRPHPLGLEGNSAVALISRGGADNDDFGGRMAATPHLTGCPYHRQVMASFNEVLARSRLMKLDAGCEVRDHVDFNYHWYTRVRIHIPVITNPAVVFYCGDEKVHMETGECWIFDNWRRHNVVNGSGQDRIHLVIDLSGSSRFWRMVRQALQAGPGQGNGGDRFQFMPYEPGKQVDIRTENYNISPVMAPGEIDALVADLVREFAASSRQRPRPGGTLQRDTGRLRQRLARNLAPLRHGQTGPAPLPAPDRPGERRAAPEPPRPAHFRQRHRRQPRHRATDTARGPGG